ncbi:MAG TPA: ATP-binding protein, partial [Thermoanaerobaculia bacterium]
IPGKELPHVFERFRQADGSATRRHSGMGIGLTLSRSLVELHGGAIWADSVSGQGSRFTFTLPIPLGERWASEESRESRVKGRDSGDEPVVLPGSRL